jgi:hypothetical protein
MDKWGQSGGAEVATERVLLGDGLTDAELTALALGADPDTPIDDDAVPLASYLAELPGLLPQWYMPPAMARPGRAWRVPVVTGLVSAFVLIEAFGLCSAYGHVVVG